MTDLDFTQETNSLTPVTSALATGMVATMLYFGVRTGLLAALARGPRTVDQLAAETGGDQRMAEEWVASLRAAGLVHENAGVISLDPAVASEVSPSEGAAFDARPGIEMFGALSAAVARAADGYLHGGRLEPESYPLELVVAMERMSAPWSSQLLLGLWIPAVPGLVERLTAGGSVAEIGCGAGTALVSVAGAFPRSRAVGFEIDPQQAAIARAAVDQHGLRGNVEILEQDAVAGLTGPHDLVLAMNVLHDAADVEQTVAAASRSLASGGALLVVESRDVGGPMSAMLLATSTLYCIPTTRHRGGHRPLGTLGLTPERLSDLAAVVGLRPPRPLPCPVPFISAHVLLVGRRP